MSKKDNGLFNRFSVLLEKFLVPLGAKISGQRHIKAIRDGMICATPLAIVGGISLIISSPPVDLNTMQPTNIFNKLMISWKMFAMDNMVMLRTPFNMTMALMGLIIAMGIGYSLAKEYKMNSLSSLIISAITFLIVSAPSQSAILAQGLTEEMASAEILANKVMAIPTTYLDAKGVFTAMVIGILTVEVTRMLNKHKIEIRLPDSVPAAISASFSAIIPLLVNIVIFYGISIVIQNISGKLIPQLIMDSLSPLVTAVDSAFGIIVISIMTQLLWLVGLHGSSIVSAVVGPFESSNLALNAAAVAEGAEMLPHIYTTPFRAFFMIIGGAGATLALVILMCRSRSAHLKAVGKLSLVPSIFNINEPIIFGAPLVLNPIMAIPFVGVQVVNGLIMYFAMKFGFIGRTFASVPWTTPAPIGAFLSTMDWKAGVAILGLIALDMVLYFPFLKAYEKQLEAEEKNTEDISFDDVAL